MIKFASDHSGYTEVNILDIALRDSDLEPWQKQITREYFVAKLKA